MLLEEMVNSRSGMGNAQDVPRTLVIPENKKIIRFLGSCQRDSGAYHQIWKSWSTDNHSEGIEYIKDT